jgi:hypothetical protein
MLKVSTEMFRGLYYKIIMTITSDDCKGSLYYYCSIASAFALQVSLASVFNYKQVMPQFGASLMIIIYL